MAKNKSLEEQIEKNNEYWQKRIAKGTWDTYNSLEEKNRELLEFYIDASKAVKEELYTLAEKYSKDGVLSLSEMHKQNRLTELNKKYEKIAEQLGHQVQEISEKNMQEGFQEVYKNTALGIDNIHADFAMPNKKLMEKLLNEPWRGDNFSGRLWKNQKKLAVGLNDILLTGLQQGKTTTEIAIKLHYFVGENFNECHRLVRTETMHYLNNATLQRYKDTDVQYVRIWAAVDERTCDTCSKYHDKVYPIKKAPILPLHPNCRCTYLPATEEEYKVENSETKGIEKQGQSDILKSKIDEKKKYMNFDDGEAANEFFYNQNAHKQWVKTLSDLQKEAIYGYTYNDHQMINHTLRIDGDDEYTLLDKRLLGDKTKKQIASLDKIISSYDLKGNIIVHRSVDAELFVDYFDDTQKLVGKEYTDKGFMSTSLLKSGMMKNKDCFLEIKIPAGKGRGAYINSLSVFKDGEYEFLIARNSKFKITEVEETDDLFLKMEMIVDD